MTAIVGLMADMSRFAEREAWGFMQVACEHHNYDRPWSCAFSSHCVIQNIITTALVIAVIHVTLKVQGQNK